MKIILLGLLLLLISCEKNIAIPEKQGETVEKADENIRQQEGETGSDTNETATEYGGKEEEEEEEEEYVDPLTAIVDGYQSVTWWNLLSQAEFDYYVEINEAYTLDPSFIPTVEPPPTEVNPQMDGMKVRIPGFVVGVDSDPNNFTMVRAFLFVPYQGACIHVPPPPTNQTIFATIGEAVDSDPYTAYWLYGIISTEKGNNDIAEYSYTFKADRLEFYQPGS